MNRVIISFLFCAGLASCKLSPGKIDERLVVIDQLIEANQIGTANDSLQLIDKGSLNRYNQAFFQLLSMIAQERQYRNFENDSLATEVVSFFSRYENSENYLKALVYQTIARMRLGSPDSMVYAPLKIAQVIVTSNPDNFSPGTNALVKYYLGVINDEHRNYELAERFFARSRELAAEAGNVELETKAAINLFWNHLRYSRLEDANLILEELKAIPNPTYESLHGIRNAEAAYYLIKNQPDNAINVYRRLAIESKASKSTIWIPNIYFSLSRAFQSQGMGDSALHYARIAVETITDTSVQRRNYLLHAHLGNLALDENEFLLAARSFNNAYSELLKSINELSDRRVLELEKQFNVTRVEMAAMQRKQRDQLIIAAICGISMLLGLLIVIYRLKLKANRGQLEMEILSRQKAEFEADLNKQAVIQKESLVNLYHHLTRYHVRTEERLDQLSYKFLKKSPALHDEIQRELGELKSEFTNQLPDLVSDDLFYTNIKIPKSISLTNSEKVIMFLLYCQTPTYQIAALLAINPGNLRVKKLNLKRKLASYAAEIKNLDEILAIF